MWKYETIDIKKLKNLKENPRNITEKDFEKLKNKIIREGFWRTLTVDNDMTVLAGNQCLKVLKELGWKEVGCKVAEHKLTDEERMQIVHSDNLHLGTWDEELRALQIEEFDLDVSSLQAEMEMLNRKDIPDVNLEDLGMPAMDNDGAEAYKQLVVNFNTAEDYQAFQELIGQELTDKTKSIYYPKMEHESRGYAD